MKTLSPKAPSAGLSVLRLLPGFIPPVVLIVAVGFFAVFQFQRVVQLNRRIDLADEMISKLVETTSAFNRLRYATPAPAGPTEAAGVFYDRFKNLLSLIEEEERAIAQTGLMRRSGVQIVLKACILGADGPLFGRGFGNGDG